MNSCNIKIVLERRIRLVTLLASCVLGSVALPLLASDALKMTPRDVAGIVSFRGLNGSTKRLNALVQRIHSESEGLSIQDLDQKLGLPKGSIDLGKPIHFIFLRADELDGLLAGGGVSHTEGAYPVIAFTPKPGSALCAKGSAQPNRISRVLQNDEQYYFLMRENVLFAANKRKSLRSFLSVEGKSSLHFGLDSEARSIYDQSDVFVHLPLAPWRNRINPYVLLASNLVKLSVASGAKSARSEETQAVVTWMIDGVRELVDQMETFTLAASFDGKKLRLDHHHTFHRNGTVASYLRAGSHSEEPMFAGLPNQPFLMAGALNWKCSGENSLTGRFNKFVFGIDSIAERIPTETRKKVLDYTCKFNSEMNGSYFMLTSPPGKFRPLQAVGGFWADDPEAMLKHYRFVQDNTCEAMAAFMPGGSCMGRLKEIKSDKLTYYEMVVDRGDLPADASEMIAAVYGKDARFQEAVGGKRNVIYVVAEKPWGVEYQIGRLKTGETLEKNERIQAIKTRLHRKPEGILIVDVGRMVATLPYLIELSSSTMAAQGINMTAAPLNAEQEKEANALLGWSCRMRESALSGRCAMGADDVVKCAELFHAFKAKVKISPRTEKSATIVTK